MASEKWEEVPKIFFDHWGPKENGRDGVPYLFSCSRTAVARKGIASWWLLTILFEQEEHQPVLREGQPRKEGSKRYWYEARGLRAPSSTLSLRPGAWAH